MVAGAGRALILAAVLHRQRIKAADMGRIARRKDKGQAIASGKPGAVEGRAEVKPKPAS